MKQFVKPWLLLLALLAFGMKPSAFTSAVGSDCLYECQGPICSDFGNKADFCTELRAKCQARCSGRRWWGAIAYSTPDHQAGWSFEFNTADAAKQRALQECRNAGGRNCAVEASVCSKM